MRSDPPDIRSAPARAAEHDIFISYNHAHSDLAKSLKDSLQKLAKRWYQRRARDVFLDSAKLPTGSSLEESVRSALVDSRAYLLIASPSARESRWVNQELEIWLAEHGTNDLFIVLADGELAWVPATRSFDPVASTALPTAALTCFTNEPLWEDLRGVDPKTEPERILAVAAGVISGMSGLPKDDLFGEDIRQQRIVKRIAVAVASVMSLLVLSLIGVSVEAIHQRDVARTNGAVANAHAMSEYSKTLLESRLATALGLALRAHEIVDDPYTRSALFQALSYNAHLVRYFKTRNWVHGIDWDGASGRLIFWGRSFVWLSDPRTGTVVHLTAAHGVSAVTGSPGPGEAVAIGTPSGMVRLVDVDSGDLLWHAAVSASSVTSIAFAPGGHAVVALASNGDVVMLSRTTGDVMERRDLGVVWARGNPTWIRFQAPGPRVLVTTDRGEVVLLAAGTLATIGGPTAPVVPKALVDGTALSTTGSGTAISYVREGSIAFRVLAGHLHVPSFPADLPQAPGAYAIAGDGAVAAVESRGIVTILSNKDASGLRAPPLRLPGAGTNGSDLRLSPDDRLLASVHGRTVGIWNLAGLEGVAEAYAVAVPPQPRNETPQEILADPSSGSVTVLSTGSREHPGAPGTRLICLRHGAAPAMTDLPLQFTGRALAWNSNRSSVLVASARPSGIHTLPVNRGCPTGAESGYIPLPPVADQQIDRISSLADDTPLVLTERGELYWIGTDGESMKVWGGTGRSPVTSFATSTDGRELLVGQANGRVQKYELEEDKLVRRWTETQGPAKVRSVVFVSAALAAVSRGDGNVYLIDRGTGALKLLATGAQGFVLSPADAGSLLVGTEPDSRVAVWDTRTGLLLARLEFSYPLPKSSTSFPGTHSALMTSIATDGQGHVWFAEPGSYLARWDFDERRWDSEACQLLPTDPTTHESTAHLEVVPCRLADPAPLPGT